MKLPNHRAFTVAFNGLANVIKTNVAASQVDEKDQAKILQTTAIWDTGATNCTITKSFATKLGLIPTGKTKVQGVHGTQEVNTYLIDLYLPDNVVFNGVKVTECSELSSDGNCAMLIGMDVMLKGDVAISNKDNKTVFSFRIPSQEKTDYVKTIHQAVQKEQMIEKHRGRGASHSNFTPPKNKKRRK